MPERDAAALAKAISDLLERPAAAIGLGRRARETVCGEDVQLGADDGSLRRDLPASRRQFRDDAPMTTALWQTFAILTVAYVPGALLFGCQPRPVRRAALSVEERLYWNIVISGALSSVVGFGLAWAGHYDQSSPLDRRLDQPARSVALPPTSPTRSATTRLTWTALIPAVLLVGGLLLNFAVPPAEYVIGGKIPASQYERGDPDCPAWLADCLGRCLRGTIATVRVPLLSESGRR